MAGADVAGVLPDEALATIAIRDRAEFGVLLERLAADGAGVFANRTICVRHGGPHL
jgi:hypothetical protein